MENVSSCLELTVDVVGEYGEAVPDTYVNEAGSVSTIVTLLAEAVPVLLYVNV